MLRPFLQLALLAIVSAATAASGQTATPTTAPTTAPIDWFGGGPAKQEGALPSFATLYPRLIAADPALRAVTPRIVYNALGTQGVPPTLRLPRMSVTGNLFTDASNRAYSQSHPKNPWLLVPDERRVRIQAVDAATRNSAVCLDIEALPIDLRVANEAEVDRSVKTIAQMAGWTRSQDPSVRLFLYSIMPASESGGLALERYREATLRPGDPMYEWCQAKRPETERAYAAWQAANKRLRAAPGRTVALADHFDGICPSLYVNDWPEDPDPVATASAFARLTIDESRLYGKPVYPFVWTRIFESRKPVPIRPWVALIREVMIHADGAILWDDSAYHWDLPTSLRVRIATLLAEKRGEMTDRDVYDALKKENFGGQELEELATPRPATQPTPMPMTKQSK